MIKVSNYRGLKVYENKECTENTERYSLPYFRKFRPEIYLSESCLKFASGLNRSAKHRISHGTLNESLVI